ncbi:hypothetical protein SDC9_88742 [bioreactor metagenome]|uniref:Uncharacterized protein n=1 Tax=bioreactor metagenome TaxID=1076179 RepID=A0A644ZMC8_9ZZZZ
MDSRIKLQEFLETITPNVYFQPPSTITMKYPAIVYSRKAIGKMRANNINYKLNNSYTVTVIDRNPDSKIASVINNMNYCEFDRQFVTDGLNHITFSLYY